MLNISGETKLTPDAVMEKAKEFFIKDTGLNLVDINDSCATFEGGGGGVTVTVTPGSDNKKTSVEVVTREWEYQVKKFMEAIKTG